MADRFTRPYVDALFAVATPDAAEALLPGLGAFAETLAGSEALRQLFGNPAVSRERKAAVLDALAQRARLEGLAVRLLHVLLANHRILRLGEVLRAVRERLDKDRNVVEARLTTAAPVADADAETIRAALAGRTGRTVRLKRAVNADLLGGFVVQLGSAVFDASLAQRLRKTRQALHAGAAQEVKNG